MTATTSPRPLPPQVIVAGSAVIAFHLLALFCLAIAVPSGPWPTPLGSSMALPPPFAATINDWTASNYLQPLYMTHPYHFATNTPDLFSVRLEVRLKDRQGNIKTVQIPDPNANFWVRHRQQLLADALANDQPVPVNQGQLVLPKDQKLPTFKIWKQGDRTSPSRLVEVNELALTGSNAPVTRPSAWAMLTAQAYVRYLCRVHDAESGELVRRHRNPLGPEVLFIGVAPTMFEDQISSFGEFRK